MDVGTMGTYASLEARGVRITRESYSSTEGELSSRVSAGLQSFIDERWSPGEHGGPPEPVERTGTVLELSLPAPSALKVEFRRESLGRKLRKWFKAEVQIGDPDFDSRVYVDSANGIALLGALLDVKSLRDAILMSIVTGGGVRVDGDQIRWDSPMEEPAEAAVVALAMFALEHPQPG
jgi:hypothetical protein